MRITLDIRKALSKGPDPQVPSRINGDGDDDGDEDAGGITHTPTKERPLLPG